jgi:MtN3 and saliva related transmembrane protein
MFGFVPQIVKTLRTRSVKDVSILAFTQLGLGVSLWVTYGFYRRDPIIIIANLVSLLTIIVIILLYFRWRRR